MHTKQVRPAEALPCATSFALYTYQFLYGVGLMCDVLMIHASITLARGAESTSGRSKGSLRRSRSASLAPRTPPRHKGWMFTIPFQLGGRRCASRRPRGRQRPIKIHG